MIRAAIITEDECECILRFKSKRQLKAYSRGFNKAADCYGAGNCGVYTEADIPELEADGCKEMAAAVRKALGVKP